MGPRYCFVIEIFLISSLLISSNAVACSCPPITSVAEGVRLSGLVFSAVVESDVVVRSERLVRVRVQQIFKGDVSGQEIIRQRPCSPELKVGSTYVVFAERSDWRLLDTECLPNIDGAGALVAELGVGRPAQESRSSKNSWVGLCGVGLMLLLMLVGIRRSRVIGGRVP